MTNKLVVIINSLKVPKIKKIVLYEMKFLVPNCSCLQNPWLGNYLSRSPSLCPLSSTVFVDPPSPNKIPGYDTGNRYNFEALSVICLLYWNENYFWEKNKDVNFRRTERKIINWWNVFYCSAEVKANTIENVAQSTNWISMPVEKTGRIYLLINWRIKSN